MRYSNSDVAHRWVHGLFDREIEGSNFSGNDKNLYSYSTVIAQCLDRDKNVFVVIDQSLSATTGKHVNYVERASHSQATVIRTHINSSYSYNHVDFLGWVGQFNKDKRIEMANIFLKNLLQEYKYVKTGKTLKAEQISKKSLSDIDKLDSIYGDCSLKEWLKSANLPEVKDRKSDDYKLRKMVRLIVDGRSDEEITDSLYGKGTWARMQDRIAPLKKAKLTRENRIREEEERRQLKIQAMKQNLDGLRIAWREHRESIPHELYYDSELYYGGNVLMRFSKQKGFIETSKGIRVSFEDCHKYWRIIKKWHEGGSFIEGLRFAGYRVESYENDILKAGCHQIAFCEMQRMYNELCKLEA